MPEDVLPRIAVLTTGGTIAGLPAEGLSYRAGSLPAQRLLESVPQAAKWARLSIEAVAEVGSQDVDHALWHTLATRVRTLMNDGQVDGVVITHGTDTLEESAFFLHMAVQANKPVVLTGAMRPAHAPGADGPVNLLDAIAAACSPAARPLGVCVLMNQTLYDAVEVQKVRAEGLDAFSCRNHGPLGRVSGHQLALHPGAGQGNPAWRGAFADSKLEAWPRVHILYAHAGMDAALLDAMLATRPDGIVVAGVGNGNASALTWRRLQAAASEGVAVVRASRTQAGHVRPGVEVDDERLGLIAAGGLSPQKARVLLLLALQRRGGAGQLKAHFLGI